MVDNSVELLGVLINVIIRVLTCVLGMQDGYITSFQLDTVNDTLLELLADVRPNAVALVDAFDFTDRLLGSVLGRYDGQVYDNLYQWALNSPLNKTQVVVAYCYVIFGMKVM